MRLGDGLAWISGMGDAAASAAARAIIERGASALVSWGTAAALVGSVSPGTLVLANHVCDGKHTEFEVNQDWHRALETMLGDQVPVITGKLAQVANVLGSPNDKRAIHADTGAAAADMESAAVARVAKEAGVPFLVVRVIADTLDMGIPDTLIDSLDQYGRPRLKRLLPDLICHPGQLRALMQLRRGLQRAQATLTRVRQLGGEGLACPK